jgi:hypothetical protein
VDRPKEGWHSRLRVNPAHRDLILWVQGLEQSELIRLMKEDDVYRTWERKGALRAYHKMLEFFITDGARNGKEVIEDAN